MKKKCNVVMLPTEKSNLILNKFENKLSRFITAQQEGTSLKPQHLYITSDDEIKEGDWHISMRLIKDYPNLTSKAIAYTDKEQLKAIKEISGAKKIIATTDTSLYPKCDGKCATNECVCLLPQIPESFIQAFIKACNEGKPITEVAVEYEKYFPIHFHELLLMKVYCNAIQYTFISKSS